MSRGQVSGSRRDLANAGVIVSKTFSERVPGGTRWEVHFRYASSLLKRADAKILAQCYIAEVFRVTEVAMFANPETIDNSFYSVFFTDWR